MSILECDRAGCTNIMCDRYSQVHGYICATCFSEMKDKLGEKANLDTIAEFMQTPHKNIKEHLINDVFKYRYEW